MTADDFRRIALGLHGCSEGAHMGHPDFRVRGKVFASLQANLLTGSLKLETESQAQFLSLAPEACAPAAGAWGRQGWTVVQLAAVDEELLGEALTLAWQRLASATPAAAARRTGAAAKASVPRKRPAPSTSSALSPIDGYIAAARPEVQPILEKLRAIVRKAAPDAEEKISYRMPAFFLKGALLYFAPFTHHIGIFPPVKGDESLAAALAPYRGDKGNLRFPLGKPMPYPLIRRVVQARLAEHRLHLASKRRRA